LRFIFLLVATIVVAVLSISATVATKPPLAAGANEDRHQNKAIECRSATRAIAYYQQRYSYWRKLQGISTELRTVPFRGCNYQRWRAKLWQERARQARNSYQRYLHAHFTLQERETWREAVQETQKAFPRTNAWLLSCSDSEGGWGRWVANGDGSGAGGWMQFLESTFWRMFRASEIHLKARGFHLSASAASWYSPLGQAVAGAWGVTHGRQHEWYGSGC